jgi:pyruvate/2-oxoglutarate/acetoin dehydrogenase E1 component
MNGAQCIEAALTEAMAANDTVHILGESLPLSPASGRLLEQYPDRCHILPAADATLVGLAVGMAISGKTPVVELSGTEALWGALQQLGQEAGNLSGEFASTIVVRVPMSADSYNPTALLEGLNGIAVASPSNPADAGVLLKAALAHRGVTVLLEPISVLCAEGGAAGKPSLGTAQVMAEGDHITLMAWGDGVDAATKAARTLSSEGISAEVLDLRSLHPLDTDTIKKSVSKTGRLVVVGSSNAVLVASIEASFLRLESPPVDAGISVGVITSKARAAVHF